MLKAYLLIGVLVYIWARIPNVTNRKLKMNKRDKEVIDAIYRGIDALDDLKEKSFEVWIYAHIGIFVSMVIFWPTQLIGWFRHTER